MNLKFSFNLVLLILFSLVLHSQQQNGYSITGHIEGLQNNERVTLFVSYSKCYHAFTDYLIAQDSTNVKNGEFHLSGFVPEGPRHYWMTFEKHKKILNLFIGNNERITISGKNIDEMPGIFIEHYVSVNGSPTNYSRVCLEPMVELYRQNILSLNRLIRKVNDSIGFNELLLDGIIRSRDWINKNLYWNVFTDHGEISDQVKVSNLAFLTEFDISGHASFWMDIYKDLDEQKRKSFFGKWLKEIALLSVGQSFPEFLLPTPDGKTLALNDFISKSKVTIIHFWSANSENRKAYQDEIRAMYKKYKNKGLNVIGVFHNDSYDKPEYKYVDVEKQWKDILKEEQYPWYNVADLRGKDSYVEKIYREGGTNNTTNVILDARGRIIAWGVKGAELQYYLWKVLGE